MKQYLMSALTDYFAFQHERLEDLPIPQTQTPPDSWRPQLASVPLPEWAEGGVDGRLLVPEEALTGSNWMEVDWWGAAWWYLTGAAERAVENRRGPIHSYSAWLSGFDSRMWERAWVNRIALFLRSWVRHEGGTVGPLPPPRIWLTHDVDAVRKTLAIRCKQTAFHLFNAGRCIARSQFRLAAARCSRALAFFFRSTNYWAFDSIRELEDAHGVHSTFFFYGRRGGWRRPFSELLFDPDYDVGTPLLTGLVRELAQEGCGVGLHPAFDSWQDPGRLEQERAHLERALGQKVTACRQHWLRFSWKDTWRAQEAAGLHLDQTLGFNDRPGFRVGAALRFCPPGLSRLEVIPMILMDSHLYDYQSTDSSNPWMEEVRNVSGEASLIWHQQVFNRDYGWGDGYRSALEQLSGTPNLIATGEFDTLSRGR